MNDSPSPNGFNGRDARGRFAPGHKHARGNPLAGKVSKLRSALIQAVTEGDIREVIAGLIKAAKGGDTAAAKLVLLYSVGRPVEHDLLQRLESLEEAVSDGAITR